ncbi:MAG TPA: PspA/IM30 family protein [Gemmataceae bacterium]
MIVRKLWRTFQAQLNKMANFFWRSDPIAQLQYEYDKLVDQLKQGREGVEQYRALVERVNRQVENERKQAGVIEAKIKAYLGTGDREMAARYALELQKVKADLKENESQLAMHEKAYNNHLAKIKHATGKLADLRQKIQKYDADLKMSRAEAELAKVAKNIHVDVTTDFGEIEQVLQDEIDKNRAKAKVAADLSSEGLEEVEHEEAMEKNLAEQALRQFEMEEGLAGSGDKALPAPHPNAAAPAPG